MFAAFDDNRLFQTHRNNLFVRLSQNFKTDDKVHVWEVLTNRQSRVAC